MPSSLVAYPSDEVPLWSCARYSITNFPSFFTTEGLNVPADSKPSPWGDTMGSGESRVHFPKGGVKGTAATAARAMRTATETVNVRAARVARNDIFAIAGIPFLTIELDTLENFQKNSSHLNIGKKSTDQKSASNRMKDSLGICTFSLVVFPFSLSSRAFVRPSVLPTRPTPPQMCEK